MAGLALTGGRGLALPGGLVIRNSKFNVSPPGAAQNAMEGWAEFSAEMRQYYGVDMSCLDERYRREQKEYYLETSAWADVHPSQMLGPPATLKEYDLLTVTLEEIAQPLRVGSLSLTGGSVRQFCNHQW